MEQVFGLLCFANSQLLVVCMHVCEHTAGLEINILRQWTTGPPALRIWWSGLKSGGPENYILHFHLKCITEHVQ